MRFQYLRFAAAFTGGLFLVNCAAKEADTGEGNMPIDTATGTSTNTAMMPTTSGTMTTTPPASSPSTTMTMTSMPMPTMTMTTTAMPTMTMMPMPTMTMTTTAMPTMTMTAPSMSSSGDDMMPAGSGGMMDMPAGSSSTPETGAGGDAGGGMPPAGGEFVLTSMNFMDGDDLPDTFTCEGKAFGTGPMPQLAWGEPPEGTLSFGLAFVDTKILADDGDDSPLGNHWAMWNIGADIREIPEGNIDAARLMSLGGATQYGPLGMGFLGPCPSGALDTYSFDLYALNVAELSVEGMNVYQARQAMEAAKIEKIALTCSSDASPN